MGVVVSPGGANCEHVDIIDDTTAQKIGTVTRREYGEIVGIPTESWTPQSAANRAAIAGQAEQALADNTTFLAIVTPTNAQNAAQVKALTRQVNKLIRLVVGRLDGTD